MCFLRKRQGQTLIIDFRSLNEGVGFYDEC